MDPLTRLQSSIDQVRPIVAATTAEHFGAPTPCSAWNVEALANHLLGALVMFRDVADTGRTDMDVVAGNHITSTFLDDYDRLAAETIAAWRAGNRADGTAAMPWGEMPAPVALQMLADDVLVHGWDLARATGQDVAWDQALAAETLEFAQATFADADMREGSFGPQVVVGADADAMTKLVAFLGRSP